MMFQKRSIYNQELIWEGDLTDDCSAKWRGLLLRAEWMNQDFWWWSVYDLLNKEKQIDSSNNYYPETFKNGKLARSAAVQIAKNYLKEEIVFEFKNSSNSFKLEEIISNIKDIGFSSERIFWILIQDFGIDYQMAKKLTLSKNQ
ncbi:hypothetical protein [uncultured Tenacibaculum sp.]|uniref:hypothetical protein n=1 Tax=uncultured Tenacibaculum sp. TaxID=174713 RepID=UPI002635BDC1|nr:hypothetical protein [uncultured Tenacibaculum sp.]